MKVSRGMAVGVAGILLWGGVAGANQIENAGFEEGLDEWEVFGGQWRRSQWSNDQLKDFHGGAFGLVHDAPPGNTNEWRGVSQRVKAKSKGRYAGGVWTRIFNGESIEVYFEIQFLDRQKKVLDVCQSEPISGDRDFTFVGLPDVTSPQGTEAALVRGVVRLAQPSVLNTFVVFDDFEFETVQKSTAPALLGWDVKRKRAIEP